MKVQATHEDTNLILRLYDLRREERLRAARKAFVVNGILNRELFNSDALRYRQMEQVAEGFVEYLNENAPGFYEKWSAGFARAR